MKMTTINYTANAMAMAMQAAGFKDPAKAQRKPKWPRQPNCQPGTRIEVGRDPRPIWGYAA